MACKIPETDEELDVLWRAVFGQPLPVLGAPKIAGAILARHLAEGGTKPAGR
ncbi:hypothetical protein [Brevundimonas subvibrioides]|uniref:DNA methylation and regulatory protein n=1 Tax=Brevundimonas subvibrioides (strain ATCC 15264 / DSM 4735 / LMG 14903 / NBRC 16000 / CB 81) TaxID=633149 RepID=D9QGF8_BRESC|nr:hypothetical protein [Brevundimonas subvibrioides]ADL00774.1 DNA methylation and regulatory protein [Brevundimonas subvibrioides ATCC 15264]